MKSQTFSSLPSPPASGGDDGIFIKGRILFSQFPDIPDFSVCRLKDREDLEIPGVAAFVLLGNPFQVEGILQVQRPPQFVVTRPERGDRLLCRMREVLCEFLEISIKNPVYSTNRLNLAFGEDVSFPVGIPSDLGEVTGEIAEALKLV